MSTINWHEDVLVELCRLRQAAEKLVELKEGKAIGPLPEALEQIAVALAGKNGEQPIWECGHRHPDRITAVKCLRAQRETTLEHD